MSDTRLPGYPARMGDAVSIIVDHSGPASYTTGGETIGVLNASTGIALQGMASIDMVQVGSPSISLNYVAYPICLGKGSRKTWKLLWVTATSGIPSTTQVSSAVNLSAETVRLQYTGR